MSSLIQATKNAFRQRAFVVAFVMLALCAGSLNGVANWLKWNYRKLPVDLRVSSLKEGIPAKVGHWMQVSTDQGINPEEEQVLGTPKYVFRDYVNIRALKLQPGDVDLLNKASAGERAMQLAQWRQIDPTAVLKVAVTYYTGLVDTVAHIPERCYVADGYEVKDSKVIPASLGMYASGASRDIKFRFLSFEDQSNLGSRVQGVTRYVGYVFHCDGAYQDDVLAVRASLANLLERYGYYAKIELMIEAPTTGKSEPSETGGYRDASVAAMKDFLVAGLPEVEKCLPDWQAIHQQPKK